MKLKPSPKNARIGGALFYLSIFIDTAIFESRLPARGRWCPLICMAASDKVAPLFVLAECCTRE
jgi:hypothetical protein